MIGVRNGNLHEKSESQNMMGLFRKRKFKFYGSTVNGDDSRLNRYSTWSKETQTILAFNKKMS